MSIAENIKQLRTLHKMNQVDFGKIAGVSDKAVSTWETGEKTPRMGAIQKIADHFGISKSDLIEDKPEEPLLTAHESLLLDHYRVLDFHGKKVVDFVIDEEYSRCSAVDNDELPTIQIRHSNYKVSAGTGFDLSEGDDWGNTIDVPDTPTARKANYALTIQGNSMEPVYHNGDIILVKQQDTVDLGQIGIFVLNGSGYIKKNGGDRLISLNDEYDDILIKDHDRCRCVGRVVGRV